MQVHYVKQIIGKRIVYRLNDTINSAIVMRTRRGCALALRGICGFRQAERNGIR